MNQSSIHAVLAAILYPISIALSAGVFRGSYYQGSNWAYFDLIDFGEPNLKAELLRTFGAPEIRIHGSQGLTNVKWYTRSLTLPRDMSIVKVDVSIPFTSSSAAGTSFIGLRVNGEIIADGTQSQAIGGEQAQIFLTGMLTNVPAGNILIELLVKAAPGAYLSLPSHSSNNQSVEETTKPEVFSSIFAIGIPTKTCKKPCCRCGGCGCGCGCGDVCYEVIE